MKPPIFGVGPVPKHLNFWELSVKIVPFTPDYTEQVVDVILTIQNTEFDIPITRAQQPDLDNIPGYYQQNAGNFWVALDGEKVVGTISLLDISNGQGALRKMFVHRDYRGGERGVARQLLQTLLDWARTHNYGEIFLGTTDRFLAAHRFYEKSGFMEVTAEDLPPVFPKMAVDNKFYKFML
ncbi:MAG: GNAT family N-acetyltransferase [Anaerolineae bacterium]|nr:GNAT family N-acetyltransferase [Anaerolineae bacterium]